MSYSKQIETLNEYWGPMLNTVASEEAGEFIQALSKLNRYETGIGVKKDTNYDTLRQNLIDEIGDLFICFEMLQKRYEITDSEIMTRINKKVEAKYE